jgi:hypothetical protein
MVPNEVIRILLLARVAGLELDSLEMKILEQGGVHA